MGREISVDVWCSRKLLRTIVLVIVVFVVFENVLMYNQIQPSNHGSNSILLRKGPEEEARAIYVGLGNFGLESWQEKEWKAPESYVNVVKSNPIRKAVFDFDRMLGQCERKNGWSLAESLEVALKSKCKSKMDLADFVCQSQCAREEPELEKSFRILGIDKYNLHGLLRLCKSRAFPFLVWIRDSKVFVHRCQAKPTGKTAFRQILEALESLACALPLPQVIFGVDTNDYAIPQSESPLKFSSSGWIHPLPGVLRLVGTDSHPCGLLPTPPYLDAVRGEYWSPYKEADEPEASLPWEKRSPEIFWRGGSTGIPFDFDYTFMMPRPALGKLTKNLEGYNYGMTTTNGVSKDMLANGFKDYVKLSELTPSKGFESFKFHVHVDGNTASWGLIKKLMIRSVVVWQRSPVTYREHYYDLLQPWKHYIPLEADLSNLAQIRDWLRTEAGQSESRKIRDRVDDLIKTRFRLQDLYCYMSRLILTVAHLQAFDPEAEMTRIGSEFGIKLKDFDFGK